MNTAISMQDRLTILMRCALFTGLPDARLRTIAALLTEERYLDGETVFAAGEVADTFYVVASGYLSVSQAGHPDAIRSLGTSDYLGEYGLFTDGVRTATVVAVSPIVLLALDYGRFRELLLEFPDTALALLREAVRRLVIAEQRE